MNSQDLISILNLENYPMSYIQKVISSVVPTYIITYDSRFPTKFIPFKRFRLTPSSTLYRVTGEKQVLKLRLTPPIKLDSFSATLPLNSFVYVRDIGGDGFLTPRNITPAAQDESPLKSISDTVINMIL